MILVDADACPVKDEIYTVAYRHKLPVRLFAATYLRHPRSPADLDDHGGRCV